MRFVLTIVVALLLSVAGCSRSRQYELRGQVLAVDTARQEITVKHEDIRGFMPGMTMPFKVRDSTLLAGRRPGDFITATLIVEDADGYLSAIASTGHAPLTEPPPARLVRDVLNPGDQVPDVLLVDESGKSRKLSEWRGRTLAVTFIYTRCPLPNFCPRMDRNFAAVERVVRDDPRLRERVRLLSISFDPDFDTPAILAEHARRVGADPGTWDFVTGSRDDIDTFAGRFGVAVLRQDPEQQEIVHNLRTAVVDGDGRLRTIFNGNDWTPSDLFAALKEVSDLRR
jgi:protein SCO1/2